MSRTLHVLSRTTSAIASDARQGIALGDELRGDGFAVALVHLATVSLDIDARHKLRVAGQNTIAWAC